MFGTISFLPVLMLMLVLGRTLLFICTLYCSNFRKKNKKSINSYSYFFPFICWWQSSYFLGNLFDKLNANIFCSYSIISSFFKQFRLIIEYDKSEVFHFSRLTKNLNSPPLDLKPLGGTILRPNDTWWYLEFFFNRKLSFQTILTTMLTKHYLLSKVWKCLEIQQENYCQCINNFYSVYVYSLLCYIAFSSGILKKHYYTIL